VKLTKHTLLPLALGAALLAPLTPAQAAEAVPAKKATTSDVRAAITPTQVINRAKTWLTAVNGHQVPYSQTDTFGGYRTDCSGYVSMALQLPKPGPNTVGLATSTYTTKFAKKANLRKGDLIIDANGSSTTRHVVIFQSWANAGKTAYNAYEQRGGHGTDHSVRSYGLGADQYDFYRPKKY
jgi:hypothetical protein